MEKFFESIWYSKFSLLSFALLPFSILFYVLIKVRLYLYDYDLLHKYISGKPSIIVGNLTVGGSGKTPFVIWLSKYLSAMGLKKIIDKDKPEPKTESKGLLSKNV